jgi:uncharacterized protein YcfL
MKKLLPLLLALLLLLPACGGVDEAKMSELAEEQKVAVTSAVYIQYTNTLGAPNGDYDPKVTIENRSEKSVTSFVVVYRFYNLSNNPLSDFKEMSVKYTTIFSGTSMVFSSQSHTHCSSPVSLVRACVKEVVFEDGAKWKNPYYKHWKAA